MLNSHKAEFLKYSLVVFKITVYLETFAKHQNNCQYLDMKKLDLIYP